MIKSRYEEHMTQAMLNEIAYLNSLFETEMLLCVERILACQKEANRKLPDIAVSNKPVLHGSRLKMFALRDYWIARFNALYSLLDSEDQRRMMQLLDMSEREHEGKEE